MATELSKPEPIVTGSLKEIGCGRDRVEELEVGTSAVWEQGASVGA
jgi:hypothetical protein